MIIYVVKEGDTIRSIANQYQISEQRLILDNGITNPENLVIGQTIVITYPNETYIVKEGDTLLQIAQKFGITLSQLYRNNAYLWDRQFIYPDEELVISYDTQVSFTTNAYAFPYIDKKVLRKALPYLTYLSILNYKTQKKGEIESYYDDTEIIEMTKQFGVLPLMLITSVSFLGERDPATIYDILLNSEYQETHALSMLKVLKEKGYYGLNITMTYLNESNLQLYVNYFTRLTSILGKEGFPVFITVDPNLTEEGNQTVFAKVDYSQFNDIVNQMYLMRFYWGTQYGPPKPVSSIADIQLYLNYVKQFVDPKKLNIGFPLLGYDWSLPYIKGVTQANAISNESIYNLAIAKKSIIQFDEISRTPFMNYESELGGNVTNHVVWFVDARAIEEIVNMIIEDGLYGAGLWNIMTYAPQLWLVINSTSSIIKFLPEV
jgi:spore germination protein